MFSNETPYPSNERRGNNFAKFKIHISPIMSSWSAYAAAYSARVLYTDHFEYLIISKNLNEKEISPTRESSHLRTAKLNRTPFAKFEYA